MPDRPSPIFDTAIPIHAVQDDNATVVVAHVPWGTAATGASKREPGDPKNLSRGYRMALGRALRNLGDALLAEENAQLWVEAQQAHQAALAEEARLARLAAERERTRPEREAKAARFRREAARNRRAEA